MHIAPSLDQSYYLGIIDTGHRDDDQVITKVLDLSDNQTMPSSDLLSDLLAGHPARRDPARAGQLDRNPERREAEPDTSRMLVVPQLRLWKIDARE